ncbi:MAG: molybdopterin-dependent oxidoreductase [Leptolyngbya sp. SIO1D8]|nr:molybdopterin-dependent oxidoreductase [Leptolyngbya sp. SIO1D8]
MKFKFQPMICFLLFGAIIGCSTQPDFDSVYTQINDSSLAIGQAIPRPQESVILTISGQLGTTNDGETIVMDIPTLESVGLVEYTVEDPFEKEDHTFTGVLMKDLLELWQVSPEATVINITALNDYQIDVPINLVREYPVIFALKQNGEYMTPDYRGPAMLVFPYDHYKFDPGTDSFWVWQIKSIEVE